MQDRKLARKKAIMRRNIFLGGCVAVLILLIVLVILLIKSVVSDDDKNQSENKNTSAVTSSVASQDVSSEATSSKETVSSGPEMVKKGEYLLDADYSNLLLVNGENPLPEDYDYEGNLITLDQKYINGSLKQVSCEIEPYLIAMLEAAWADGVKLYVWSPYRSYDTQKMLYNNQVKRCEEKGLSGKAAEDEAATVVARPGTSEHHTGLACDFNMASDKFETTAMYEWMKEHAAEYGFIMRYSKEKQPLTGVIHESWHWRFVGIKAAKQMNTFDMCLEEYVEFLNK